MVLSSPALFTAFLLAYGYPLVLVRPIQSVGLTGSSPLVASIGNHNTPLRVLSARAFSGS